VESIPSFAALTARVSVMVELVCYLVSLTRCIPRILNGLIRVNVSRNCKGRAARLLYKPNSNLIIAASVKR
jgi:hypothetical protein